MRAMLQLTSATFGIIRYFLAPQVSVAVGNSRAIHCTGGLERLDGDQHYLLEANYVRIGFLFLF